MYLVLFCTIPLPRQQARPLLRIDIALAVRFWRAGTRNIARSLDK